MSTVNLSSSHNPPPHPSPPSPKPPAIPASKPSDPLPPQQPSSSNHEPPSPPPPPNFSPFFTIISSTTTTTTTTTHHPTVQYIFSDDVPDSDPITAAALHVLDPTDLASHNVEEDARSTQTNKAGGDGSKERYILLDMDASGTNVLSAQSMSPDWAVVSTEVAAAPAWDEGNGEGKGELMLRIEGMEVPVLGPGKGKGKGVGGDDGGGGGSGLEELVDIYEKRMGELRRVVDAGTTLDGRTG